MNKNKIIILKIAAILLILIGLLAMLVAWELLLVSNIHNSTVLVLEMGGVVICMAGYFLRRRIKASEKPSWRIKRCKEGQYQSLQKRYPGQKNQCIPDDHIIVLPPETNMRQALQRMV